MLGRRNGPSSGGRSIDCCSTADSHKPLTTNTNPQKQRKKYTVESTHKARDTKRPADECDLCHRKGMRKRAGQPPGRDWPVSQAASREGWVKDLEGNHRLWVPPRWRASRNLGRNSVSSSTKSNPELADWHHNTSALRLQNSSGLLWVKF